MRSFTILCCMKKKNDYQTVDKGSIVGHIPASGRLQCEHICSWDSATCGAMKLVFGNYYGMIQTYPSPHLLIL